MPITHLVDIGSNSPGNFQQKVGTIATTTLVPPPTRMYPNLPLPKRWLEDVGILEITRQLTIMESCVYQWIKPMEIFQRSQEETRSHSDSITAIVQCLDKVSVTLRPPTHSFTTRIIGGELGSGYYIAGRVFVGSGCSNKAFHEYCGCTCFCVCQN